MLYCDRGDNSVPVSWPSNVSTLDPVTMSPSLSRSHAARDKSWRGGVWWEHCLDFDLFVRDTVKTKLPMNEGVCFPASPRFNITITHCNEFHGWFRYQGEVKRLDNGSLAQIQITTVQHSYAMKNIWVTLRVCIYVCVHTLSDQCRKKLQTFNIHITLWYWFEIFYHKI